MKRTEVDQDYAEQLKDINKSIDLLFYIGGTIFLVLGLIVIIFGG